MSPSLDKDKHYTYADYTTWDDGNRYELMDGVLYVMEPGATIPHQDASSELHGQLWAFLRDKPWKVYHPPCDVCLNADGDNDNTVVQPDLFVVCDLTKLDGKRCNGAPDFVIEILSLSSVKRDMLIKFNVYIRAGVREYWIVDLEEKIVRVCLLKDGKYETTDYIQPDSINVSVLDGCEIDMSRVFDS